jgi:hypothetical protein
MFLHFTLQRLVQHRLLLLHPPTGQLAKLLQTRMMSRSGVQQRLVDKDA